MTAPYQTDLVGSFLRPEKLSQARQDFRQGTISREDLTRTKDETIN